MLFPNASVGIRRVLIGVILVCVSIVTAGCIRPNSQAAPSSCQYDGLIHQVWERDADWAVRIAWRESRCTATSYNRSGATGVFQLLGHQDLLNAVCMNGDGFNAECNIRAAWLLYQSSGRSPWGG